MTNTQTQENIQQLQAIEQNMQHLQVESALEELKKTDKAYRIIGNIMVASEKSDLEKELTEKKDRIGIRVKSFEKQETSLKDQAKALREEIMKAMQAAK